MQLKNIKVLAFFPVEFRKTSLLFFCSLDSNKRITPGFKELYGQQVQYLTNFNGVYVTKVKPDGLGTQRRCLSVIVDFKKVASARSLT
jgi:hypothetical protein